MNALKDDDGKLEQLNCIRCWIGRLRTYRCDVVELSCAGHNGKFGAEYCNGDICLLILRIYIVSVVPLFNAFLKTTLIRVTL